MDTLLSWSTGKDAAWALQMLRRDPSVTVRGLFTTVNEAVGRVAMHGVRLEIAEAQAKAAGLPLHVVPLPYPCPNEAYERIMGAFVARMRKDGARAIAFGDLFLEDVRAYRERTLEGSGVTPLFPLWGRPTQPLARAMIAAGLRAHVTCLNPAHLDRRFAGQRFDSAFLNALPAGVDPCGENGEFHTCVTAGPMFAQPLAVEPGEVLEREGFVYADLRLNPARSASRQP